MKSDFCKRVQCANFSKSSGKAACYFQYPRTYLKHLDHCPATLKNE